MWNYENFRKQAQEHINQGDWTGMETLLREADETFLQEQNRLLESEERFRIIFKEDKSVKLLIDSGTGQIVDTNPTACDFYGYSYEELLQLRIQDINILSFDEVRREMAFAKDHKKNFFHFRHRLKDGNIREVEVTSNPIRIAGKDYLFSIIYDITEKIKFEKDKQEKEELYQLVINTAAEGFWMINAEQKTIEVNQALCDMLGYSKEELLGHSPLDFANSESYKTIKEQLEKISSTRHRAYRQDLVKKSGDIFPAFFHASTITDDAGKIINSFAFVSDVSERDEVEKKLQTAKDQAEQANMAKSIFLANMSHEIRTPLNSVIGFADLLDKRIEDSEQKSYIQAIKSSGRVLLSLINDILDFAKIESGRMHIQEEDVNLLDLLNDLQEIFLPKVHSKKLDFLLKIPEKLPLFVLDKIRVRQVLFNLISNAVKFTEKGSINVQAEFYEENKELCIKVKDTGIGIPKEKWESIFDVFRQQDEADSRKYEGSGLGLSISKKLIEMMKGSIEVESEVGKGSEFSIRFFNLSVKPNRGNLQYSGDINSIKFKKSKVLIVDDVDMNRHLLSKFLEKRNIQTFEAGNGLEAIEIAQREVPEVILMDLRMPGMDGYETGRRIRAISELELKPMIAITGSTIDKNEKGIQFDAFINKPVQLKDVILELSKFLPYEKIELMDNQKMEGGFGSKENNIRALQEIRSGLLSEWEKIKKRQSISDVKSFAQGVCELGKNYTIPILTQYGNTLLDAIKSFDIQEIKRRISDFQGIVNDLEREVEL
ncbi:MAG: PAS domain S-box protein [Leptospiraceae bacterium]|nr:PAS domain S-box protein [Leptospiraceae bacterium]MCP5503468.1 PAS domain S-box protein [Leptospiraceae bacterium]